MLAFLKWEHRMYKVIVGKIERKFDNLTFAKKYARQFLFSQIVDSMNIVRFIVRDGKIFKSV